MAATYLKSILLHLESLQPFFNKRYTKHIKTSTMTHPPTFEKLESTKEAHRTLYQNHATTSTNQALLDNKLRWLCCKPPPDAVNESPVCILSARVMGKVLTRNSVLQVTLSRLKLAQDASMRDAGFVSFLGLKTIAMRALEMTWARGASCCGEAAEGGSGR